MDRPPESIAVQDGVELRREREDDAPALAEAIRSSLPELRTWMSWAGEEAADPARQRALFAKASLRWDEGAEFVYMIVSGGSLVGCMGLHRRVGPAALEIGYWLRTDHTGRGIVTACARSLTGAALGLDGIERVEIHCDEANTRSRAVPLRLGYRLARVQDDAVTAPGEVGRDMVWVYPPC